MAADFPMSLRQLIPILDIVGYTNKHLARVGKFMHKYGDLELFPVKLQVGPARMHRQSHTLALCPWLFAWQLITPFVCEVLLGCLGARCRYTHFIHTHQQAATSGVHWEARSPSPAI